MQQYTTNSFIAKITKLLIAVAWLLPVTVIAQPSGNGKKVYADYHGTRYTREHDGVLGRWSYYRQVTNSESPVKVLCYNADNILENGRNDIAATDYPLTGVQSDLDPDYIEYQILTAKAAGIDGFFIEWGFPEHESNKHLKAFQQVAGKYNFEIGVNWCDRWLYYDWITKIHPEIKTRADKTKQFQYCFQYLIDSVFTGPTAPIVKGMPVFYLFGGGITNEEYKQYIIDGNLKLPRGIKFPVALKRFELWGKLVNDVYEPPPTKDEFNQWIRYGMSPTAWIPPRLHAAEKKYPSWNFYGTPADVNGFMSSYKVMWKDTSVHVPLQSGFVVPGMDNRGCAGWGHDIFYLIPRDSGQYYNNFWQYNMEAKDKLDMMFIASWSDFTEGHEIQPTIENGYRELKTTLKNAAQFKNEILSEKGLELPLRLFQLRKKLVFLQNINKQSNKISIAPDAIALLISNTQYDEALKQLMLAEKQVAVLESRLIGTNYVIADELLIDNKKQTADASFAPLPSIVTISDTIKKKIKKSYYTSYITFEYLDEGILNTLSILASGKENRTTITGEIKTADSGMWKKAKIKIQQSSGDFSGLLLKGDVLCRNVAISFTTY